MNIAQTFTAFAYCPNCGAYLNTSAVHYCALHQPAYWQQSPTFVAISPPPLTVEDVRRIVREELDRVIAMLEFKPRTTPTVGDSSASVVQK